MVRLAQKQNSHEVTVSSSYFVSMSYIQPSRVDRSVHISGYGFNVWADFYAHWTGGLGWVTSDSSGLGFSPSNYSVGTRRWSTNMINDTSAMKMEYKFSALNPEPVPGTSYSSVMSSKLTTPTLDIDVGNFTSPVHAAGDSDHVMFETKASWKPPYLEKPHILGVRIGVDGSVSSGYAWTLDFNNQWRDSSEYGDNSMTYLGGNTYQTFTSLYDSSGGSTYKRWLITWELSPTKESLNFVKEQIQLSDPVDDAIFNNTTAERWGGGSGSWTGFTLVAGPYGWCVTVDLNISGSRVRRYWQFNKDFTKYREILFIGADPGAEAALSLTGAGTLYMEQESSGNIVVVPLNGTFYILGSGIPETDPWTSSVADPTVKAWGYSMDGHDMYVLKLGLEGKTLVYDLSTDQWAWWATEERETWRPSIGTHWISSGQIPVNYGSNVITGDDTTGDLWVLDPEECNDDGEPFTRIASAQMFMMGRKTLPVFSVYLTASSGEPSSLDNEVTLEYTDDIGETYVTADAPQINSDDYEQEFTWRSLGLVQSPGRIFRLIDKGSFSRIDALNINEV